MEHVPLGTENVVTIFFQGNNATRVQACKYAGKAGLDIRVTDDNVEHVFNPKALPLLHNLFLYNELNDIGYGFSWNPLHWYSAIGQQISRWYYNVYGTACMSHNNWSLVNLAGPEDVAQCVNAIKECIKQYPKKHIVLFGTDRGAATLLVALTKLNRDECDHIGLVIAEAPFASVPSLLYNTMHATIVPYLLSALEQFTLFRIEQFSPLQAVTSNEFPLSVPLLFVTSDADRTVPKSETLQLIEVLKKRDHQALEHLQLKNSHHSMMSLDNKEDQDLYFAELQRLYRKYL